MLVCECLCVLVQMSWLSLIFFVDVVVAKTFCKFSYK